MEDHIEKSKPSSRKRSRKPKSLDFVGWGSKNLIDFLESLGRDTTNKISEYDATDIVRKYIRELNVASHGLKTRKKKTKIVTCDVKLSLLFGCQKINMVKLSDLVSKHYVENQEDEEEFNYLYSSEDDDEKQRLSLLDKVDEEVVQKRKGSVAAIVRDNVKLVYLRKGLVMELAKKAETFEGKVVGTFVRIKNPCQLVQVTGVKKVNLIDGYFLQVTNYCYYLKDVASSALSDDDFTQEECEELQQRIKNGSMKRLTVMDMEEKVRTLHEDVTKHWIARELELLRRQISQASEKGWKRELSQYLDRRELLSNPEEQSRLLLEVPEVIAEETEPECVDDVNNEDDFMEPNPEASFEILKLCDEEDQPTWAASAGDNDLLEDVEEQPTNVIIIQNNKDSIYDQPQAQSNPLEIVELSDDDDAEVEDNDKEANEKYDPKKKMWWYEMPKGIKNGPFSLADFKEWSDQEYFDDVPDFSIWKTGNSIKSAVLLTKLLNHIKD